jgi:hypothetical protein
VVPNRITDGEPHGMRCWIPAEWLTALRVNVGDQIAGTVTSVGEITMRPMVGTTEPKETEHVEE